MENFKLHWQSTLGDLTLNQKIHLHPRLVLHLESNVLRLVSTWRYVNASQLPIATLRHLTRQFSTICETFSTTKVEKRWKGFSKIYPRESAKSFQIPLTGMKAPGEKRISIYLLSHISSGIIWGFSDNESKREENFPQCDLQTKTARQTFLAGTKRHQRLIALIPRTFIDQEWKTNTRMTREVLQFY